MDPSKVRRERIRHRMSGNRIRHKGDGMLLQVGTGPMGEIHDSTEKGMAH